MSTLNKMKQIRTALALCAIIGLSVALAACGGDQGKKQSGEAPDFEAQVADYIQKFPYQDTQDYAMQYTQGKASNFNVWILGKEPALVKAGEDKVVRMNNDTYYKMAFVVLDNGPVVLASSVSSDDRFCSFQLMDDRNANYRNIIGPKGDYTLYHGERPETVEGEAIEVPSNVSVVIVRVEVKDKEDAEDVAAAKAVFNGITIKGPTPDKAPEIDLLSGFDKTVADEALRRIDEAVKTLPFLETIVGPGQEPGKDVPYLNLAAGTKGGWGGPAPSHSAYQFIFNDVDGDVLDGSKGTYTITTEEPGVDAFWSVTVYDTARGGFLHPNKDDRYHINNTGAVKNDDGTVTFTFKTACEAADKNCLEVPAGPFDVVFRFYAPREPIRTGAWTVEAPKLEGK